MKRPAVMPRAVAYRPVGGLHPALVLACAAALCAGIVALGLSDSETGSIGSLYTLPVALVALALGRWGGLASGLVAVGLFTAVRAVADLPLDAQALITHFVAIVGLGLVLGYTSDRLRAASMASDAREHELRASERRLREAHELARLGSWEWDVDRDVATWSDTMYALFEVDPAQFTPTVASFLEFVHPDDRSRVEGVLTAAAEGTDAFAFNARIVVASGKSRSVEVAGQRLVHPAGARGRMVGTLQDVSRRVAAEDSHAELEDKINQLDRLESVGQLAGGIAHDFNNLLAVILNYAAFVERELPDSPVREDIHEITKAAESAAALTRQLLIFSRRDVIQPEVLDLNEVVRETESMLARTLGEDVALVTSLAECDCEVKADRSQLEQVLVNLAVNARDAMPEGGRLAIGTDTVTLDHAYLGASWELQPGPYVRLTVSDTGEGIPREAVERIFDPFFTTKPKGRGTGLGLATVHGIAHAAGGGITVSSEPGRGTRFQVYLPAAGEHASGPRPPSLGSGELRGTETVLVVEDEEGVRRVMTRVLATAGYDVIEARDGQEALVRIRERGDRVGLVITDVVMPGISGKRLADEVRESHPETRILFCSGYTDDVMLRHGIAEHRLSFLDKPFTADALLTAARRALDHGAVETA